MNNPILSICIPVYNEAAILPTTLDNVVSSIQDIHRGKVEIVVSDNCSEDSTPEIVYGFRRRFPNTIRYVRNDRNMMFNGNVQRLIGEAAGDYIHFLGGDDLYKENGLSRIVETCESGLYDFIAAPNDWLLPNGRTMRGSKAESLASDGQELCSREEFLRNGMVHVMAVSNVIVRRSALSGYVMTRVPDWGHLDLSLFVMANSKRGFIMPEVHPCVSIRTGVNAWLSTSRSREVWLNSFRTILDARRFGYTSDDRRLAVIQFAGFMPVAREIFGTSLPERIQSALGYFKAGGRLAFPIMRRILKKPFRKLAMMYTGRYVLPADIEIVIIAHGHSNALQRQLHALANQTVRVGCITVIDNGSTDDTASVVRQFGDERFAVRYYPMECRCENDARCFQLSQQIAQKKYIAVFRDDDIVHPQFVELALRAINEFHDVVVVSGGTESLYNPDDANLEPQRFCPLVWHGRQAVLNQLVSNKVSFSCCVCRTDVYKSVRYDDGRYGGFFGEPFLLEMLCRGTIVSLRGLFMRCRLRPCVSALDLAAVDDAFPLNAVARAKALLPGDLCARVVRPRALADYLQYLCRGTAHNPLRMLRIAGIITRAEHKIYGNACFSWVVSKMLKRMKMKCSSEK